MTLAAIALGSNIDPKKNLQEAASLLRARFPGIRFSRVYRTAPEGYTNQADFFNAAAVFDTEDSPEQIYDVLTRIESALGKATPFKNGPRTIDLDLIVCGDAMLDSSTLTLPHPRAHTRRFVLEPLTELLPSDLQHPALGQTWQELLSAMPSQKAEITDVKL